MTTRSEFWSDCDATPRGESPEPVIPPHASACLKHNKLYRVQCPYCAHEKLYPGTSMDDADPKFYMRGRRACRAPRRKKR